MPEEFDTFLNERLAPAADQLDRRARRVATLTRRLSPAAASGDMKAIEAALRDLQELPLDELLRAAVEAVEGFDYREYLQEGFAGDFEAACRDAGLPLEGNFPSYFIFPFAARIDTENPSAIINRKRAGSLRPSVLVKAIADERERLERSPFNAVEFLATLYAVWDRMNALQSRRSGLNYSQPQRLKHVYRELVPFARWRRDYPESFFGYDLQRLMLSGTLTHEGYRCVLDRGRSAADALRMVDREGQERLISTLHFVAAE